MHCAKEIETLIFVHGKMVIFLLLIFVNGVMDFCRLFSWIKWWIPVAPYHKWSNSDVPWFKVFYLCIFAAFYVNLLSLSYSSLSLLFPACYVDVCTCILCVTWHADLFKHGLTTYTTYLTKDTMWSIVQATQNKCF